MPRYQLALFDFDGTLADSFPWFLSVINEAAAAHGFRPVDPSEVEGLRSLGSRAILKHLGVPLWKLPSIGGFMKRLAERDAEKIRLFDGVPAMLRQLADGGVTLAIVTSNDEGNVRRLLGPELASRIGAYGCGASLLGKASKLRQMLKRTGLPPGAAIMIGDEARDLEAAQECGIDSLAVAWGYAAPAFLRSLRPTLMAERVTEIPAALGVSAAQLAAKQ